MAQTSIEGNEGRDNQASDNTSAINISKNPVMHAKTNHIAIKYHYVRELVEDK